MRPDDDRVVPFESAALTPDLEALAGELAAAGARAGRAPERPSLPFAAGLRGRLLSAYPTGPTVPVSAGMLDTGLQVVVPRVERTAPGVMPRWRWPILAVAAVLVLVVIGGGPERWFAITAPSASAVDAVGATLTRDGASTALAPGMTIRVGDVVTTAPDGSATLALGGGAVRLAGDTQLGITGLEPDAIGLDQVRGRAWHRVGPGAGRYRVTTAGVTWTATGTAFDLDRRPDGVGGEEVRGIGIEHAVRIGAPGVDATLAEGSVVVISLTGGGATPAFDLGPVTADVLADPWLVQNADRDVALGFDPGILDQRLADMSPSSQPEPTGPPDVVATDGPPGPAEPSQAASPPVGPTERPTAKPTPEPTPKPTEKPTPKPTPAMASLSIGVTACPGEFTVLSWSKAPAAGFDHYQTVRSTSPEIKAGLPPRAPGVAPDALYGTDRGWLGALDRDLEAGTAYSYRTLALDGDDRTTAASPVRTVTAKAVKELGGLDTTVEGGSLTLDWASYGGPEGCFTWYKLVASTADEHPECRRGRRHRAVDRRIPGHERDHGRCARSGHIPRPIGGAPAVRGRTARRRPHGRRDRHDPLGSPLGGYSPVNRGGRFSRKAAIPSA